MLYGPLGSIHQLVGRVHYCVHRSKPMLEILREKDTLKDVENAKPLPPLQDKIELRNLEFSYPSSKKFSLFNINLDIPKGSTVALVGRSGAGKVCFI